ncbi:MAG TPA: hypothetical protein VFR73_23535, partial [Hyphomicrobiaceae bacterium]|nr:hypothetical protein [Hyphomicrobiaceae bacterium]
MNEQLDTTKLNSLLGTMVNEMGAAANAALVLIGDKLGLFRALAGEALTPAALAAKTGTRERYVREWLAAQAASGFVTYDAAVGTFTLSPEQAAVFAHEDSVVNMTGGFYSRGEGVYRVELLAQGPRGDTVIANFPLYAGVDVPESISLARPDAGEV